MIKKITYLLNLCWLTSTLFAASQEVLNIYTFGNYIPRQLLNQFTNETGIKVNLTECENNETLIAKLNAYPNLEYDLAVTSSFYLPIMSRLKMLQPLDFSRLNHYAEIHPFFVQAEHNPLSNYSLPYCWGVTGIIVNRKYFELETIRRWQDLWQPKYRNQLMILNDMREVFTMALLTLNYSVNESQPSRLHQAYTKILELSPNIRVINVDCVPNIYIDEDLLIGMAWSGDYLIAKEENPSLDFILPEEGFTLWFDSFVLLKNAPHLQNAYLFLNFIYRPDIAQQITPLTGFYSTLSYPLSLQLTPSDLETVLQRGQIQHSTDLATQKTYETYWHRIRLGR